jgi:nickel/cobalt exporter
MGDLGGLEQQLIRVFDDAPVVPLALLAAAAIGAAHGLAPGHGKTLVAGYLVGARARRSHAAALAGLVAAMHTVSVLALGLFWWLTVDSGAVPIEATTRWAQLIAALAVLAVGTAITRRRWRERRTSHHHHQPPHTAPWSRAGLVGIASVGGLLPSPAAFLVLVSGLLTGRAGFALAMVASFGLGLAAIVLAAGLVTITGRDWIIGRKTAHPRLQNVLGHVPLIAAGGVLAGGCLLSIVAVSGLLAA